MRLLATLLLACLAAASAQALDGFHGDDLAVTGRVYTISLPAAGLHEVQWGDGSSTRTNGTLARHLYSTPGVAVVSVADLTMPGNRKPLRLDPAAVLAALRPLGSRPGEVKPGANLPVSDERETDSFSFACRVRGGTGMVFSAGSGAVRIALADDALVFTLRDVTVRSDPLGLTSDAWHHVAVTYERAPLFPHSNRVRFYLDGCSVGARTLPAADAGPVRLESARSGAPDFHGELADAAVFDRVLFPLQVRELARVLAGAETLPVTVATEGASEPVVVPPAIARTVEVALDPGPAADNGPALRKALSEAEPGTRVRIVPAGGTFAVRSLIEGNKWTGLLLEGRRDVEFDGNGATLVYSDKVARYLYVLRCQRVAVRNVAFDLAPDYARVGTYARLTDVDPSNRTIRAQLVSGRPGLPPVAIPRRANFWRWRPHDPVTLRIATNGPYFQSDRYAGKPEPDPAGGAGAFRVTLKAGPEDKLWRDLATYAAAQNFFLINHADFSANAVSLDDSRDVTFSSVHYFATLGMVFLASGTERLRVEHCRIGLPLGQTAADRPLAAGADGYHFHQMRGGVVFEDNVVELTDDDPVSIKDGVWTDLRRVGERALEGGRGVRSGHPIELLAADYQPLNFTAVVVAATGDVLMLDRPLPAVLPAGALLVDREYHTADWVLRNNRFRDYYGRVMLYADHGTFRGNRVDGSLYHLGNSVAYFEKSGVCRNVITHGNFFSDTTADCMKWGGDGRLVAFREIVFSANSFEGRGLHMRGAEDGLVALNLFDGPAALLEVGWSRRVQALGNVWRAPGAVEFVVKGQHNEALTVLDGRVEAWPR